MSDVTRILSAIEQGDPSVTDGRPTRVISPQPGRYYFCHRKRGLFDSLALKGALCDTAFYANQRIIKP